MFFHFFLFLHVMTNLKVFSLSSSSVLLVQLRASVVFVALIYCCEEMRDLRRLANRIFNMDPPISIYWALLLLVTTQYSQRNNEVTSCSHLTRIQALEVWAVNYAFKCKNPQTLRFLENMNMDSRKILFQQKPLCQIKKVPWEKNKLSPCILRSYSTIPINVEKLFSVCKFCI